jgi:tetratricopeptide (TPR) repeat protein
MAAQEIECEKCGTRSQVVDVIPFEEYNENVLACKHKFYTLTTDKTVGVRGTRAQNTEVVVFEGELPCLLVYSDKKHVNYINDLLSLTENSIRSYGFKPQRLSTEIKSGQDYFAKISSLLDSCALVLVILDGFRPNVTFEFGYALAKNKPIIIIRSRGAEVNIKNLYRQSEHSGLNTKEWEKLKDPILDPQLHLSDFAGKHICLVDRAVNETDESHLTSVLKGELPYQMSVILKEFADIKTKDIDPNILKDSLPHLMKIISLYNTDIEFEIGELKNALSEINKVSEKHQQEIPDEINDMAGSAFIRKAKTNVDKHDVPSAILSYREALQVFNELLSRLNANNKLFGSVNDKTANTHLQLYGLEGGKDHLTKAIELFSFSLTIITLQLNPLDYATIKSNIALAYHKLSLLEIPFSTPRIMNSIKAVVAFEEASQIYTIDVYPLQYGGIHNNLGNLYMDLAAAYHEFDNSRGMEYWRLAINSFSEALKVFKENQPLIRAGLLNSRGSMHQNIAMIDVDVVGNSQLAINDINESLKIYTLEKYPYNYATGRYNDGVIHMKLYGYYFEHDNEHSEDIRQHSISSFKDAAGIFDNKSKEYYDTAYNLGNIYMPLEKTDYTVSDCKNAIDSYIKSLEWYNDKLFSFHYAMTWYSIGLVYSKLMHLEEKEINHAKMSEAFANALVIINEQNNFGIYRSILQIISNNRL